MSVTGKELAIIDTFPYPVAERIISYERDPWHIHTEKEDSILDNFPYPIAWKIILYDRLHRLDNYKIRWNDILDSIKQRNGNAHLFADYVYLDTHERRAFANAPHEYLIDQLQVPLPFYFNRNPGLAVPTVALPYNETRINIELRPPEELMIDRRTANSIRRRRRR